MIWYVRKEIFAPALDRRLGSVVPVRALQITVYPYSWDECIGIWDGYTVTSHTCVAPIGCKADVLAAGEEVGISVL